MRARSSTTSGYSFWSLWFDSARSAARLGLERDPLFETLRRASISPRTTVDLPAPGGPAITMPGKKITRSCKTYMVIGGLKTT